MLRLDRILYTSTHSPANYGFIPRTWAEDAAATLEELAQKLRLHSADRAALRDEVLHTVACKSAIKAGMTSDPAELRALAAQVQSGAVRYCPHGRPVAVKLSEYEIEKMFKRA